jgi:hypothetical protein
MMTSVKRKSKKMRLRQNNCWLTRSVSSKRQKANANKQRAKPQTKAD